VCLGLPLVCFNSMLIYNVGFEIGFNVVFHEMVNSKKKGMKYVGEEVHLVKGINLDRT